MGNLHAHNRYTNFYGAGKTKSVFQICRRYVVYLCPFMTIYHRFFRYKLSRFREFFGNCESLYPQNRIFDAIRETCSTREILGLARCEKNCHSNFIRSIKSFLISSKSKSIFSPFICRGFCLEVCIT